MIGKDCIKEVSKCVTGEERVVESLKSWREVQLFINGDLLIA